MKRKLLVSILTAMFFCSATVPSNAQTADGMLDVLKSGFFGGLIGTMIGGAVLLLIDNPDDHLEVIGYGAGSGIILGTVYGIVQLPRNSFAEFEEGRLSLNVPTVSIRRGQGGIQGDVPWIDQNHGPYPAGFTQGRVELDLLKVSF